MLNPHQKRRLAAMERSHQIVANDSHDTTGRIIDLLWSIHNHSVPTQEDIDRLDPTKDD